MTEMRDGSAGKTETRLFVRKSEEKDIPRIMEIYGIAQEYMIAHGNPSQWGHFYPKEELIREDIRQGISYVVCEEEEIHGVFALCGGEDPTYLKIYEGSWLNDEPYLTIHRTASDGRVHGVVRCVSEFAKGLSDNVRIDTHHNNKTMQSQVLKAGFTPCGIIYVDDGSPRIAYHWKRGEV